VAFRGHFEHTLDAKNRLSMPAKFRAAFSDGIVLQQPTEPCVAVWTQDGFESSLASVLAQFPPGSAERRSIQRYYAAHCWDAELDSAGRVTMIRQLLAHAGVEKDVVVVGNNDHLELWEPDRWRSEQNRLGSEIPAIEGSLGHPS
jgi:MraZ protein